MGCSPKGVLAVQFYNRSSFVTEDIEICQSYMTVLSSSYQCLCFTPMESSAKAMIISCLRSISRFDLEIQCPLAKMSWKNVNHHGCPTKKTCQRNSLKLLFFIEISIYANHVYTLILLINSCLSLKLCWKTFTKKEAFSQPATWLKTSIYQWLFFDRCIILSLQLYLK